MVEEMRYAIRAIAQLSFIPVFNVHLLEHTRAKKDKEEEKWKICWALGRVLLEQLSFKADEFIKKSMNVRKILGPERVKAITSVLKKNNTTTSAKVREAKIKK